MSENSTGTPGVTTTITLERDTFMRQLIAGLSHLNEGVLGSDVAGAYIMNLGLSMGAALEAEYKRAMDIDRAFTLDEYAHVIVDLEQHIHGNFSLVSKDPEKVIVQTTSCPFEATVRQSPSLCFTTSSIFGGIAARNFGYAKVVLHRRIALGDPGCYVTVHLKRTPEAKAGIGKEYFPNVDLASPDIAEQLRLMDSVRRLRRQLGEVNARWEEIVHDAADAIWVLGPDGRVAHANARWRDILGVEADELVGGDCERVIHPNDQQRARDTRKRALKGERSIGVALRMRHRDQSWHEVLTSIGPVRDEDGRIIGALEIVRDVTEQRETQRLKDDFLTTASHELRTPVTNIKVLTEVLLRTLKTRGPVDQKEFARRIEMIQREADRLTVLGTELLDVSLLQSGKLATKREVCDLNDLVEECVTQQRDLLGGASEHALALLLKPTQIWVNVERRRVEQIIANLLDNAVKYSPEGGEIAIATESDGHNARVTITDQGIGIPEPDLPKLFTPFYRGSNASSRHFSGLGLGLYVSQAMVEMYGGQLTATSHAEGEGSGATFTITIPLDEGRSASGATKTVLIVDDDEGFQETLQTLLEMEGYDVVAARDGFEALLKLDGVTPALILLDIMMPHMNGFQFIEELERRGLRPAIPILVLTADGRAKQHAEQMRADAQLAKPFDVSTLLTTVQQLVRANSE